MWQLDHPRTAETKRSSKRSLADERAACPESTRRAEIDRSDF